MQKLWFYSSNYFFDDEYYKKSELIKYIQFEYKIYQSNNSFIRKLISFIQKIHNYSYLSKIKFYSIFIKRSKIRNQKL